MSKRAFTLVELLASMAVLAIIVLMLGRVFTISTGAWRRGKEQVDAYVQGRTAVLAIAKICETAMVDEYFPLWVDYDNFPATGTGAAAFLDQANSALFMLSFTSRAANAQKQWTETAVYLSTNLQGRGVLFLRENTAASTFNRYISNSTTEDLDTSVHIRARFNEYRSSRLQTGGYASLLANNLFAFKLNCLDEGGNPIAGTDYYSKDYTNTVPAYLEIMVEVLDENQWQRTNWMNSADFRAYAVSNVVRFTATVAFPLCTR
ncbi:MAG: type II secretion system protein [Kiritimatiellae bacterium]|nr:type II secretion system protein [Kiritimatiellia bacterium]